MRFDEVVHVTPATFPEDARGAPGDLATYAPMGNGVGTGGLPIMPWGGPPSRSPGYALYEHQWDPFLGAPPTESRGGTVYFDQYIDRADLDAMTRVLGIRDGSRYAVYVESAADIGRRRFGVQVRIVTDFAMEYLYRSATQLRDQPIRISEALWRFVELADDTGFARSLGGDGDWASETAGYGLLVENSYYGVYRIWNRPWLVSK